MPQNRGIVKRNDANRIMKEYFKRMDYLKKRRYRV